MRPTLKDILQSACAHRNQHLREPAQKKQRAPPKSSKNISWMHWQIQFWCGENKLVFHKELQFHKYRKYRLDFAVTDHEDIEKATLKLGVEYQGGIFMEKSGHSNYKGATRDADKANLAQSNGWTYLTFTAMNYKGVLQELEKHIHGI